MNWTIGTAIVFAASSLLSGCAAESDVEPSPEVEYGSLGTEELKGAYNFLLEVDGKTANSKTIIGGFKSMSGMDSETESIELKASGAVTFADGYANPPLLEWDRGTEAVQDLTLIQVESKDSNTPVRIALPKSSIVELEMDEESERVVETLSIQFGITSSK